MNLEDAKAAAKRLRAEFPHAQGVGIGAGHLIVYLRVPEDGARLPLVFDGYAVKGIVIGEIIAAALDHRARI
jgi:hypothetical protein